MKNACLEILRNPGPSQSTQDIRLRTSRTYTSFLSYIILHAENPQTYTLDNHYSSLFLFERGNYPYVYISYLCNLIFFDNLKNWWFYLLDKIQSWLKGNKNPSQHHLSRAGTWPWSPGFRDPALCNSSFLLVAPIRWQCDKGAILPYMTQSHYLQEIREFRVDVNSLQSLKNCFIYHNGDYENLHCQDKSLSSGSKNVAPLGLAQSWLSITELGTGL